MPLHRKKKWLYIFDQQVFGAKSWTVAITKKAKKKVFFQNER